MAEGRIRKGTVLIEYQDRQENQVVYEGQNIVGRNPNNSRITIKDRSISDPHGKIIYQKGVLKIIDTGSKNGIYHKSMEQKITPNIEMLITPKDVVYFAEIKCTFTMDPVETIQEAKQFTTKAFKPILKPMESQNEQSILDLKKQEKKIKNQLKALASLNKQEEQIKKNENSNEPMEDEKKEVKISKKQAVPKIAKTKKQNNFQKFQDEEETNGQEKITEKKSSNEGGSKEVSLEKKSSKVEKKKQSKQKLVSNLTVKQSNQQNEEQKEQKNQKQKAQQKKKTSQNKSKGSKAEKEKKKSTSKEKEPEKEQIKNTKNERSQSQQTKAKGKAKQRKNQKKNEANVQSRKRVLGVEQANSSPFFHPRRCIIEKKILTSAFNLSFTPSTKITIVPNWRDSFDLLVMQRYSRTFKLLYAICLGIPVVNSNWILNSEYKRAIVPIDQFLLQGPVAQKDLITNSIKIAQSGKKVFDKLKFYLLETDKEFHLPLDQIEALIEAGGGTLIKKIDKKSSSENNETVIITKLQPSQEDFKSIKGLNFIKKVYTIQLILQSCLTQSINWEQNKV